MSSNTLPPTLSFSSNGGSFPAHGVITASDHGPYVVVTTWILMCTMVLSATARLGIRMKTISLFTSDNVIVVFGTAVFIVQCTLVHLAVNNGLGRHQYNLSRASINEYNKYIYGTQLLSVIVLWSAKISLIAVLARLSPSRRMRFSFRAVFVFISLWSIAAVLALAFQCRVPQPWAVKSQRCFDRGALFYSNGVINIMTDLAIMPFPALIVWGLQMKIKRKLAVVSLFWLRIIVGVTAIIQLVTLSDYLHAEDQTWHNVNPTIWTQIVTGLSLITANIPLLKPFLKELQSGLIDASMPKISGSYQLSSMSRSNRLFERSPPTDVRDHKSNDTKESRRKPSISDTPPAHNLTAPYIGFLGNPAENGEHESEQGAAPLWGYNYARIE